MNNKAEESMVDVEKFDKIIKNLNELFDNPELLGSASPEEWYEYLKNKGYNPQPLGDGNFENMPFESGGGFRIFWGGDKMLQYHPQKRTHHGNDAYWKLSSGKKGIIRYDLSGNIKPDKG